MRVANLEARGAGTASSRPTQRAMDGKMEAGAIVAPRNLTTVAGDSVPVPDPERFVHLHFRRFAGCPICELHLRSLAKRHAEIVNAGIREVVLFYSTTEELAPHVLDLPFAVVADPYRRIYAEFGVGASARSLLDPRAWWPILRGVASSLWGIAFQRKPAPSLNFKESRLGLPADFLIAGDGTVAASKYGVHAYDQWSVDEILGLLASRNVIPTR